MATTRSSSVPPETPTESGRGPDGDLEPSTPQSPVESYSHPGSTLSPGPGPEPSPGPESISELEPGAAERLPPISVLFLLLGTIRQLIVPALASAVAAPGFFAMWLTVLLVPAVLGALIRLWTFSYELRGDELVIRQGLLTRTERNIPLARIQNLDKVENPLHRLFKVAEVRLETASGGKPEAVIRVLTHGQIQRIRAAMAGGLESAGAQEASAALTPLVTQSLKDLTILGLLSNRGMLVVAAAAGLLQQSGFFNSPEFLDNPEHFAWLEGWLPSALETLDPSALSFGRLAVISALLIALFVAATRVLSVAWVIVALYGFRLEPRGEDFSSSYGLLTRVTATLPRRRLQMISIHRPWLGRPWRLASMKVETAGGGGSNDQQGPGAARLWLAPLVDDREADSLVLSAMPAVNPTSVTWRALAPFAARRALRRNAVLTMLATLPVFYVAGTFWGLLALVLAVPAAWAGYRGVKRSAWGFAKKGFAQNQGFAKNHPQGIEDPDRADGEPSGPNGSLRQAIFFRSGIFDQRESLVPLGKIQCVSLRQTPFDRRWRMASLRVDTAGASAGGHRVEIPYLEEDLARELAKELTERAAATTFQW